MTSKLLSAAIVWAIAPSFVLLDGCGQRKSASEQLQTVSSAGPIAKVPVDHLLPGELSASSQLVFGLAVPNAMTIERAYPDAVHLVGNVTVAGVSDYLRKHAQTAAPELTGSKLVFDRARIPGQDPSREYRFEVTQRGRQVELLVRDVTPARLQPGLSEEERWRQAGLTRNGEPLSISDLR